jgi:hypothetical protein
MVTSCFPEVSQCPFGVSCRLNCGFRLLAGTLSFCFCSPLGNSIAGKKRGDHKHQHEQRLEAELKPAAAGLGTSHAANGEADMAAPSCAQALVSAIVQARIESSSTNRGRGRFPLCFPTARPKRGSESPQESNSATQPPVPKTRKTPVKTEVFSTFLQARPTGIEPATTGSTVRYSNQLSYGPEGCAAYGPSPGANESWLARLVPSLATRTALTSPACSACCSRLSHKSAIADTKIHESSGRFGSRSLTTSATGDWRLNVR